jgi:hypothetical protein
VLVFGFYLVYKIVDAFKQNAEAFAEDLPSQHYQTKDYSNLFSVEREKSIQVNEVLRSKVTPPISLPLYSVT